MTGSKGRDDNAGWRSRGKPGMTVRDGDPGAEAGMTMRGGGSRRGGRDDNAGRGIPARRPG